MTSDALRTIWDEPVVDVDPTPPWWDRLIVTLLVPTTVLEGVLRDDVPWPAFTIVSCLVCVVAVLGRRRFPLGALLIAYGAQTIAGVLPELAGLDQGVLNTTACFLLFPWSLARWGSGRHAVVGLAVMLALHFTREPLYDAPAVEIVFGAGFLLLPAALGGTARLAGNVRQRNRDQLRLEERGRIARELHDSVAHHVSAIVIQAQAGRTVASTDPDQAPIVLARIEEAAQRSLEEMRSMVATLRSDDLAGALAPAAGIAELEGLATAGAGDRPGSATDAPAVAGDGDHTTHGPEVLVTVAGDVTDVDAAVDAAIYRIAQEAVTNARRHARDARRVRVEVTADEERVRVRVSDDGRDSSRPVRSAGYGLVGMAERVELLGGSFRAGPTEGSYGGWTVDADVPRHGARS